jgi:hypothetical protein
VLSKLLQDVVKCFGTGCGRHACVPYLPGKWVRERQSCQYRASLPRRQTGHSFAPAFAPETSLNLLGSVKVGVPHDPAAATMELSFRHDPHPLWRLAAGCLAMCLILAGASQALVAADGQPLGPGEIQRAIERARDFLVRQQKPDGHWDALQSNDKQVGATGLVLVALANAGLDAEHPAMRRGLAWIRTQVPDQTYHVALQTMALAMLSPEADAAILARNVAWLEAAQVAAGPQAGGWSYGLRGGGSDNSNAQFALLALHEASRVNIPVSRETWVRSQQYWVSCANADGSWGYSGRSPGTGSMTCAGIASVWITSEQIGTPDAQAARNGVSCCGGGRSPMTFERGLDWLGRRFSVTENPGTGDTWLYYYLYGMERVGRFTARRFIGDHDWYREGARMFIDVQDRLTGHFKARRIEDEVVSTSFALLFLAKGRRPVIVAKSRHGPEDDWNRHGHDIAHLVEYVEGRWKKDYPAGLSWHVLDTPVANHADLMQAPVFWLSGKVLFNLGPEAGPRLRAYIDEGGFVFAEACCPNSGEFDRRFRQLVGEIFPEPEYRLNLLTPEHPAWHAEEVVPPELQRPLLGIDYGCRTCLIYVPPSDLEPAAPAIPSLSCYWELGGPARKQLPPGIRREVEASLAIGANVLAYATNREVKRKDELFDIQDLPTGTTEEFERGQLAIGKLSHAGMCDAAPAALANILRAAARETGIPIDDTPSLIDPGDKALFDYHLVFMHGRKGFSFDPPRREKLAVFLERGGTILADAICAAPSFAAAFRREIAEILPGRPLEKIPADDPIFTAADYGGYDIREVTLREPAGGDGPLAIRRVKSPPRLEGVRIKDRWAVIFSPYDISCALEKQNSMECAGYSRDDAEKIALNVLLYSLNQ